MRQIPQSVAAALHEQLSEPLTLAIVWAERGPEDRIITGGRWSGADDAAAADDAGVAVADGALILAAGSSVAMDPAATPGAAAMIVWEGRVTEVGQWVWA